MHARSVPSLTIRTCGGEEDFAALAALYTAAASVDGSEYGRTVDEMRQALTSPGSRPEENDFLFEVDGQLVAHGRAFLEEGPSESVFKDGFLSSPFGGPTVTRAWAGHCSWLGFAPCSKRGWTGPFSVWMLRASPARSGCTKALASGQ